MVRVGMRVKEKSKEGERKLTTERKRRKGREINGGTVEGEKK